MATIEDVTKAVRHAAMKAYLRRAMDELKSQGGLESQVYRACLNLYRGKLDEFGFIDRMVDIISDQYNRAFNAGLTDNGIARADAKDEWLEWLQNQITAQEEFILKLGTDVLAARDANAGLAEFKERAQLWANRYAEIQSETTLMSAKPTDLLEWELGATEQHCATCAALNGAVATAAEWAESGLHPQGAPNPLLECGGWRCDCRLIPTDKERTGIPI